MGHVVEVSRAELIDRRDGLLRRLHADSVAELRQRADSGTLAGEDYELVDQLRDALFLLGE